MRREEQGQKQQDIDALSPAIRIPLVPGPLSTTLHVSKIEDGDLASAINCDRSTGIFKVDKRFRRFQAPGGGWTPSTSARGMGFGVHSNGDVEIVIVTDAGQLFRISPRSCSNPAIQVGVNYDASLGTNTAGWSANLAPTVLTTVSDDRWYFWQYGDELYGALAALGVIYKEIGVSTNFLGNTSSLKKPEGKLRLTSSKPAKAKRAFKWNKSATFTVTSTAAVAPTGVGTTANYGYWVAGDNTSDATYTITGTWAFEVGRTTAASGSNHEGGFADFLILGVYTDYALSVQYADQQSPNFKVVFYNTGTGQSQECKIAEVRWAPKPVKKEDQCAYLLLDTRGNDLWEQNEVDKVEIVFNSRKNSTTGQWRVSDIHLAGVDAFWDGQIQGDFDLAATFVDGIDGESALTDVIPFKVAGAGIFEGFQHYELPIGVATEDFDIDDVKEFRKLGYEMSVRLELPNAAPYSNTEDVRFYWRPKGGKWKRIKDQSGATDFQLELNNTGDKLIATCSLFNGNNYVADEWYTDEYDQFPLSFAKTIGVSCGASWKGSNVLFTEDGLAYFSRTGQPRDFIWLKQDQTPEEAEKEYIIDASDEGRPRTLAVSHGRNEKILAAVAQDSLYAFGRRAGYAFVGEYPAQPKAFIEIPGAVGICGKAAACAYQDGALFGSDTGLYYVEVAIGFVGQSKQRALLEVTKDIRASWDWLLGTNSSNLVVRVCAEEIHCYNQTRYLARDRDGRWRTGTRPSNVYTVEYDAIYGTFAQLGTNHLAHLGWFNTDDATALDGTGGTAVTWSAGSKRFIKNARALSGQFHGTVPVGGSVSLQVNGFANTTETITWTNANYEKPRIAFEMRKPLSQWFDILLTGTAGSECWSMETEIAAASAQRSNLNLQ